MKTAFPFRCPLVLFWTVLLRALASPCPGQSFNSSYDLAAVPGVHTSAVDVLFYGVSEADSLGYISGVADLNGDGVDDLIASSYGADAGSPPRLNAGKVFVWFGRASLTGTMDLATTAPDVTILGASAEDTLTFPNGGGRRSMKTGDLNGDGTDDLIIGSGRADGPSDGRNLCGEAYIIFGRKSPAVFPAVLDLAVHGSGGADVTIYGAQPAHQLTSSDAMASADLNGDGRDDLIVGAPGLGIGNTGYIIFGRAVFPSTIDLAAPAATGGIVTVEGNAGNGLFALDGAIAAGDVNGDGTADLVLGDPRTYSLAGSRTESGEAYIIYGRRSPAVFPDVLDLTLQGSSGADVTIHGASSYDGLSAGYVFDLHDGTADPLITVADVNGDGTADVILGSATADGPGEGRPNCGETYLIFGRKFPSVFPATLDLAVKGSAGADVTIYGASDYEQLGSPGGLTVADVNGDGTLDLIMGASHAGTGPSQMNLGAAYIVFGRKAPAVFPPVLDLAVHGSGGADVTIYGGEPGASLTYSSALRAGDVNGDGVADLILGAPFIWTFVNTNTPRFESGAAYILFGRRSPLTFPTVLTVAGADVTIYGKDRDHVGEYGNYRIGDLNHDGIGDLILTNSYAYGPGETRWNAGKIHVLFGHTGVSAPASLAFSTFSLSAPPVGGAGWHIVADVAGGAASAGLTFELQYSENFSLWTTLVTVVADSAGNAHFDTIDPLAGPIRFYRVRRP